MKNSKTTGYNVSWIITIIFVILKLTNQIDWSWLWVCSPILIPVGVASIFALFVGWCVILKFVELKK